MRSLITLAGIRRGICFTPDELRSLAVPTLMVWGVRDPVVALTQARAIAELIPQARLEELDAGHAPQLGHCDTVASLLTSFAGQLR